MEATAPTFAERDSDVDIIGVDDLRFLGDVAAAYDITCESTQDSHTGSIAHTDMDDVSQMVT